MENCVSTDTTTTNSEDAWKASKTCLMLSQMGLQQLVSIVGSDPAARAYSPASDIKWLFPMLFDAASHAVAEVCSTSEEYNERCGAIKDVLAELTGDLAHSKMVDRYAPIVRERFDKLRKYDEDGFNKLATTFMFMSMLAYSLSVKAKLTDETTDVMNPEVSQYFAMANLCSELSPDTVRAIQLDLAGKSLYSWMFETN